MKYIIMVAVLCSLVSSAKENKTANGKKMPPSYFKMTTDSKNIKIPVLPNAFSLKDYCPPAIDMSNKNLSLFYSFGYYGFSILKNIESEINDGDGYKRNVYSPYFLAKMAKNTLQYFECNGILSFDSVLAIYNKYGICYKDDYDDAEGACSGGKLDAAIVQKATLNKNALKVEKIEKNGTNESFVNSFKQYLANKKPVIVQFKVLRNFFELDGKNPNYTYNRSGFLPAQFDKHAVCIGYDDNTKQLEFAYAGGTKFGKKGYFNVNYDDASNIVIEAYAIALKNEEGLPLIVDTKTDNRCYFKMNININDAVNVFHNANLILNEKNVYELEALHERKFNFSFLTGSQPYKLYVFNVDPDNNKKIIFPYNVDDDKTSYCSVPNGFKFDEKEVHGDETLEPNTNYTIPNFSATQNSFSKSTRADEVFIILLTKQELDARAVISNLNSEDYLNHSTDSYLKLLKKAIKKNSDKLKLIKYSTLEKNTIEYHDYIKDNKVVCIIVNIKY